MAFKLKTSKNTEKIFEKGYTTKENAGDSHGFGLWTVRRILNSYLKIF